MPDNPYDEVPYTTYPMPQTHPARIAAAAYLYGMTPAPVERCRVLEIGSGDGNNLIPMAYHLPGATFRGIDIAARPVAAGRETIAALGLTNIALDADDLRHIDASYGEFDYILAHGLYSWIPADVRERLLAVCAERLAPMGVAFVSYNCYPGRHLRQMLREMMLQHIAGAREPAERIRQARDFLVSLKGSALLPRAWRDAMDEEIGALLEREPGGLYHDELAPINDAFYFHEFTSHAASHGLQFIAEAEVYESLQTAASGEQYLDYLRLRRFRQSLLCRKDVALATPSPARMERLHFSQGSRGIRIRTSARDAWAVTRALADAAPLPLPFDELIPYGGNAGLLFTLVSGGFAEIHRYSYPCQEEVTERPIASRLARYQAERSNQVTNACHRAVHLDDGARRLILKLDGTRSREQLRAAKRLDWFARMGLLEG